MPIQGFSTGKDITLAVITTGGALTLGGITSFESRQMTTGLDFKGIDGTNKYAELPIGWEGSFDLDRSNSQADDFFAGYEATYYAGGDPGVATITETINEANGAITQYRYNGVALKYAEAGSWKGDAKVTQRISFRCTARVKVQ